MPQITLVWAALGLLIGLFARLTGARPYYPRDAGHTLTRWALAATAAALGASAMITLLIALLPQWAQCPKLP